MDDIRETIINYEDEGGGERDTDYDLNVLRGPPIYEDKPYKDLRQREANEVPVSYKILFIWELKILRHSCLFIFS